jgi:hypothetical protein
MRVINSVLTTGKMYPGVKKGTKNLHHTLGGGDPGSFRVEISIKISQFSTRVETVLRDWLLRTENTKTGTQSVGIDGTKVVLVRKKWTLSSIGRLLGVASSRYPDIYKMVYLTQNNICCLFPFLWWYNLVKTIVQYKI